MASNNGDAARGKLAKKLVSKDYTDSVSTLGEQIYINRQLLLQSIGEFDPENISLQRMFQMRRDPMIKMGLFFCKFPLIRSKWHIECEDERISAGLEEIIRKQYGAYMRVLLNKYDFGFQGGIKQFELGEIDGTFENPDTGEVEPIWTDSFKPVVLAPPLPIPPDWARVRIKKGKFDGINALLSGGEPKNPPWVPADWALWTVNEFEEGFRNWYGYPRTGYAYRYWWSSWFRHHMWDRHFEFDADPPLQVHYPPGSTLDPATGQTTANRDIALQIGADARQGATVAVPSDVHIDEQGKSTTTRLWELEFLTGGENLAAFKDSAEYLDILKLRAIMVPEQAVVEGKSGTDSRASSLGYAEIFQESLAQEGTESDDYWTRYIIPALKDANWGSDAPSARMVTTGFESEDLELTNELIKLAFQLDPNALPIKFDELLKRANLPAYSAKEQEERQEAIDELKAQQEQKAMEDQANQEQQAGAEPPPNTGGPTSPSPGGVGFSQRPGSPVLNLHQNAEPVPSTAPTWARQEHERRSSSQRAIAQRIEHSTRDRYEAQFALAAQILQGDDGGIDLGVVDVVKGFVSKVKKAWDLALGRYNEQLQAEMASAYHAAGAAELTRLGMNLSSWDVGRIEVQDWAAKHAGDLIVTLDQTLVDQHLRPWLASELQKDNVGEVGQDIAPVDALALADRMTEKFQNYPLWMAQRVARTESRMAYNNSAIDMWERVGIEEVQAYDGMGGLTGVTDVECLHRNGEILTLAQARQADAQEHPNGTLGFVPELEGVELEPLSAGSLAASAVRSESIYAVDGDGLVLSEEAVGRLLSS